MRNKKKAIIAAVAGAAIMAGTGGTFALWFDQAALGSNVDSIATGNLDLTVGNVEGRWVWTEVSNSASSALVDNAVTFDGNLVPGDQIKWEWTASDIDLFLTGDTIVANLYLDDVAIPAPVFFANLAAQGLEFYFADGDFNYDDAAGRFTIATGLTATNLAYFELGDLGFPTITVAHRVDGGTTGFGYDSGWGRELSGIEVIDLSAVTIRLQQITV
jgi:alternate signal-mediated exported protein